MKTLKEVEEEKILIDTNILVNCGRDEFGEQFKKILRTLKDNGNALGVSTISGFEIIKKFSKEEEVIDYYLRLLNYIINLPIDTQILNNAAHLANVHGYTRIQGKDDHKKDNDIIIGSTASTHEALLLTCNRQDFTQPFWDIEAQEYVMWDDKERESRRIENVYLLKFNYEELEKSGMRLTRMV